MAQDKLTFTSLPYAKCVLKKAHNKRPENKALDVGLRIEGIKIIARTNKTPGLKVRIQNKE